jgi:hypothetical protein
MPKGDFRSQPNSVQGSRSNPVISTQFRTNRAAFAATELAKYVGQWIAFNQQGTDILASGNDLEVLEDRLKAIGLDPNDVVVECIPQPDDELCIGGVETV